MTLEMSQSPLFEKRIVSELSENELLGIDGGATPLAAVYYGVTIFAAGYAVGHWLHDKLN